MRTFLRTILVLILFLYHGFTYSQAAKWNFQISFGPLFNLDIPSPHNKPEIKDDIFYPPQQGPIALFYQKNYPGKFLEMGLGYKYNNTSEIVIFYFIGTYKARYRYAEQIDNYFIFVDQTLIDRIYRFKISNYHYLFKNKIRIGLGMYYGIYYDSFWKISKHSNGEAYIYEYKTTEFGVDIEGGIQILNKNHYKLIFNSTLNYDISISTFIDFHIGPVLIIKL